MKRIDWLISALLLGALAAGASLFVYPLPEGAAWRDFAAAFELRPVAESSPLIWMVGVRKLALILGVGRALRLLQLIGPLLLAIDAVFVYVLLRALYSAVAPSLRPGEDYDLPPSALAKYALPDWVAIAACTLVLVTSAPFVRMAQFCTADFCHFNIALLAGVLWLAGSRGRSQFWQTLAYALLGFLVVLSPTGLVPLGIVLVLDFLWRRHRTWELLEDTPDVEHADVLIRRQVVRAKYLQGAALFVSIASTVAYLLLATNPFLTRWTWQWWFRPLIGSSLSPAVIALLLFPLGVTIIFVCLRRLFGPPQLFLSALLTVFALSSIIWRVCERDRDRYDAFAKFAALTAESCSGTGWFFTDGALDDLLRLTFVRFNQQTAVIPAMRPPDDSEREFFARYAPEPPERGMFRAGGAEVLKSWARERPDLMARSAWQLGTKNLEMYLKGNSRVHGLVLRTAANAPESGSLDDRVLAFARTLPHCAQEPSGFFPDPAIADFDSLLWRVSRILSSRGEQALANQLNAANRSLKSSATLYDILFPSLNVVLTPREGLELALKRADFALAERYAKEVLVSDPRNEQANFAVAMQRMAAEDYGVASMYFLRALEKDPDEPAALNNLSLCQYKLGKVKEALQSAERALKRAPDRKDIRKNIDFLKKALSGIMVNEEDKEGF